MTELTTVNITKNIPKDVEAQIKAVRGHIGMIDRSGIGKLAIRGADRFTWLQGMVSNDVRLLERGVVKRLSACILDATGHILTDLALINITANDTENGVENITEAAPLVLMELDRNNVERIAALLDRYIIMEDVAIEDVSDQWACISFQGPAIASDGDTNFHHAAENLPLALQTVEAILSNKERSKFFAVEADHTGSGGWDLFVPSGDLPALKVHWLSQGYISVGAEAQEILRVEAGIPKYGVDMDVSTLAPEAGLTATHISLTKGCYVGQEIVARIDSRGHTNRALTGLLFAVGETPVCGDKIVVSEETGSLREIGWLTSVAASSPAGNGCPIALGYVRHEHREPGSHLQVQNATKTLIAQVVALPFYFFGV